MTGRLILILGLAAGLAGCGAISDSSLNPFNWFGGSSEVETLVPLDPVEADPRQLIDQVTELRIERTPGGAIVRAAGLPPTQGYWDGALIPENRGDPVGGVLTYQFRISEPVTPQRVSTERSRRVTVGAFLTEQALEGVREIRVVGARNARAARR